MHVMWVVGKFCGIAEFLNRRPDGETLSTYVLHRCESFDDSDWL